MENLEMNIPYDQFLRSFAVKPNNGMALLLGAGCSVNAGIPSASSMVWEFKRLLYCANYQIDQSLLKDIESETIREKLQGFCDAKSGFPPVGSEEEYSCYFQYCYPNSIDRKLFIQQKVRDTNPTIGHKCIGAIVEAKKIDHIWTTNFDELIENGIKAINPALSFEVLSQENAAHLSGPNSPFPRILKLHGDFRYDALQNTDEETQSLNKELGSYFEQIAPTIGLLIAGYSGRDKSVMDRFSNAVSDKTAFPFGLTWAIRKGDIIPQRVQELLQLSHRVNPLRHVGYVEIDSFDTLMYDLYRSCSFNNSHIDNLAKVLFQKRRPLSCPQVESGFLPIKLNGVKAISYPTSIWSFSSDIASWKDLRQVVCDKNVVSALHGQRVYVLGNLEEIKSAFGIRIKSSIVAEDVNDKWLFEDSFYIGMLYDLVEKHLVNKLGLIKMWGKRGSRKYYLKTATINHLKSGPDIFVYEAIEVHLECHSTILWLVLLPTVEVVDVKGRKSQYELQSISNEVLSSRYNEIANQKLDFWLNFLSNNLGEMQFGVDGTDLTFQKSFCYCGFSNNATKHFFQNALIASEPRLLLSPKDNHCASIHPLKGLLNYGPYDSDNYVIPQRNGGLKLALISPESEFARIIKHLNGLADSVEAVSEKEYLVDYPGFSSVYRRSIIIPNDPQNRLCVLVKESETNGKTILEFYDLLKKKIDYFDTMRGEYDVLVVYCPTRWKAYREQKEGDFYFDLHDSIKLYSAKRNIKIQFIEDKSIDYFDKSKVRWWLSLGLYVKASGIPWKTEFQEQNSAYVGIGYSTRKIAGNPEVVIGCSQIFDASGEGLRFLLQPIQNPVYYGKNPFMGKEDSRRLISKLRDAYFQMDPNSRLDKITIHKTTHFTREEMEGMALALEGIQNVELLQIQQATAWRGIRSGKNWITKKLEVHNYPIHRGTAIQLDDFSFLLWTSGSVVHDEIANGKKNYYQSKRGIPGPLIVRRFRGCDPMEKVVREILSLTKMNWNSGGLHKILPVTLDFSKTLSGMAKQAESLPNKPHDFRFFM